VAVGPLSEEYIQKAAVQQLNPFMPSARQPGLGQQEWFYPQKPSAGPPMCPTGPAVYPFRPGGAGIGSMEHPPYQATPAGLALPQGVRFRLVSDIGGSTHHFFVYNGNRLLVTDALGGQAQWKNLPISWHRTLRLDAPAPRLTQADAGSSQKKSVAQMTDEERLIEALTRAVAKVPDTAIREFMTPLNIALMAGMTIALLYTGIAEVLALGVLVLGAVLGGLDLLLNVTKMAMEGYKKAVAARSERELDDAAELFSKALVDGLFDILSIVTGLKARNILRARGLFTVGEYFAYLKRELQLWRASRAAAALSKPPVPPPPPPPPPPKPNPPPKQNPPKGGANRAAAYGAKWPKASLRDAIDKFAPGAKGVPNATGEKIIYPGSNGRQVVYDTAGKYFRIEDTTMPGKRRYIDMDGNVPNNKVENGRTTGRSQAEYNQVTHFTNID